MNSKHIIDMKLPEINIIHYTSWYKTDASGNTYLNKKVQFCGIIIYRSSVPSNIKA